MIITFGEGLALLVKLLVHLLRIQEKLLNDLTLTAVLLNREILSGISRRTDSSFWTLFSSLYAG